MRDILTSPRMEDIKRKKKRFRFRLTLLFLILFVAIVGALAYFSTDRRITISDIQVSGNHIIDTEDVKTVVQSDMAGRYAHVFARANTFIYPKRKIYNDLLTSFPRIQSLSVYRTHLMTLHIDIVERAGAYLYCGSDVPQTQTDVGENCFFVNDNGYIFDKAPYFSGNVYFKYYLPQSDGLESPLGSQLLSPTTFQTLTHFIEKIRDLKLDPVYLSTQDADVYVLHLNHAPGATSPVILFKNNADLTSILENLTTAINQPEFANDIHSKYDTLQYIDLRFKNKVLYKFQ
jgi:hypothetical protein